MSAVVVVSDAEFDQTVLKSDKPVMLDFWAEWCQPCKMLTPTVEELAGEFEGQVLVGKLNVDDNPNTATNYGIRGIPTLLFIKDGQVVQQLVGVKSKAEIKKVIEEKSYEVLLYGEIIGFDPDPYPFWHSSQNKVSGLNLSGFNNEEADKLLEEARVTTDKIIREEKYKKFQEILTKEKPAIFLYQPLYSYTVDKNIKGVKIDKVVSPADRFSNVEDWYVKTKKQFFWEQ